MPRRTLLALVAFLAFVSLSLPDGLLGVSWPSLRLGFGVPLDTLGTLVAFQTLGYLTTSSLAGRILRVVPIGGVLALSTLAAALALLGFAVTSHWPLIVTAVLTSGHVWRWSYVIAGSAQGLRAAATRCGDPSCGS